MLDLIFTLHSFSRLYYENRQFKLKNKIGLLASESNIVSSEHPTSLFEMTAEYEITLLPMRAKTIATWCLLYRMLPLAISHTSLVRTLVSW